MNLTRALAIDGWMTEPELHWLATKASTRHSIIEWGCYLGRSTVAMAQNTTGVVWAMDDFKGPRDVGLDKGIPTPVEAQGLWARFQQHTHDIPNIKALHFDHRSWADHALLADMVFIDGSHTYEHVRQDLMRFVGRPHQLLCGHDIDMPTVLKAVREMVPLFATVRGTSLWYQL